MRKTLILFLFLPFFYFGQSRMNARSKEEARRFIDSLRTEILKGNDFNAFAALFSEDPGSAKRGGQLSPFGQGQMVPEFEEVAFKLKPGEISEIFESKFGFHLMQVIGREEDKISARHILISFK